MKNATDVLTGSDPFTFDAAKVRQATGLSQREFANKYGFSLRTLQDWEQGRKKPDKSSMVLLGLIFTSPKEIERIFSKMTIQSNGSSDHSGISSPKTYLGMTQGQSYAFADLPKDQASKIVENLFSLGWFVGGGHPLMNSSNLPPIDAECVRIWGINWKRHNN